MTHNLTKARAIVHRLLAIVVPERLFVQIAEKMERLYCNIRAFQSTLEQAPEILKAIGMHAVIYVRNRMVDNLVLKIWFQTDIRHERVSVDRASCLNVVPYLSLKRPFAAIGNGEYANLSAAFQDTKCSGFVFETACCNHALSSAAMHEASRAANETLVGFDFLSTAPEHKPRLALHGSPDAMQHEPCGFLRHAQRATYFVRTDTVLTVTNQPYGNHPFVHPESRILE